MTLNHDICRCHDAGCNQAKTCARFTQRCTGGERTPHCESLFPYDIPLASPCPHYIEDKEQP